MALPQLVHLPCTLCHHPIATDRDGSFCDGCGNPVHTNCLTIQSVTEFPEGACSTCGGDPNTPVAVGVRAERAKNVAAPASAANEPRRLRPGVVLGFIGCILMLTGTQLPLIEGSRAFESPEGQGKRIDSYGLTAFDLGWLGNTLLAFASAGGVFLVTKFPRGTLAFGVAILVLVLPLPWQIEIPRGSTSTNPHVAALLAKSGVGVEISFGWFAWCALVVGGALLAVAGGHLMREDTKAP